MLDMLKERKAALEAQGKKGFTLMEMLIVIAIIAILIAIAIPIFTSQLENARVATEHANARSTYAEAAVQYMDDNTKTTLTKTYDGVKYDAVISDNGAKCTVTLTDKKSTNGPASYVFP